MSDGNFNRSLLPYNNYQSGNRAGRAQMKHVALEAFKAWLSNKYPAMNADELNQAVLEFKSMLE